MLPIAETIQGSRQDVIADAVSLLPPCTVEFTCERRREPRHSTDRLTLLYLTDQSKPDPILCRILDYSRSGLKIRTHRPLEPGTEVRVTLREMFAVARVQYCIPGVEGFDHGIHVQEVRSAATARIGNPEA